VRSYIKEMVYDVRDCVLCFTDNIYPDASANCRYCIRGIGGEQVTLATGTDEAERDRQMSAEGSRECTM
jgi:hypothetical protein